MTQRKFKVGDRVVNVKSGNDVFLNKKMPKFTSGVVVRVYDDGELIIEFDYAEYSRQTMRVPFYEEIELEDVINSPLYQALL